MMIKVSMRDRFQVRVMMISKIGDHIASVSELG